MQDFQLWKKSLKGKTNVRFKSYSDLNHLMMKGTGKSQPSEYETSGNVAEEVVSDIAKWILMAE